MTPELDMNKHTSAGGTGFKASRVAHDTDGLYPINARHCRNCVCSLLAAISWSFHIIQTSISVQLRRTDRGDLQLPDR